MRFIHNCVITDIQWMVHQWVLVVSAVYVEELYTT
jgi:hypothetical protein